MLRNPPGFIGRILGPQFLPSEPQGRLTLTTATPVLAADVTGATTIFYTPRNGLLFPWWNGLATVMTSYLAELSLALDSNAGHTGYQQSGKNFDLFIENTTGTPRLVSGPAWTSDTARATALELKNGFLCNAASMTAKFDASASTVTVGQDGGTYVGTFRATADGQTAWVANPAPAAGGGACTLYLWNMYNRVLVSAISKDSTDSWVYSTATVRAANNNNANRISVLSGQNEDAVTAVYRAYVLGDSAAAAGIVGIGLNSTSAISALSGSGRMIMNGGGSYTFASVAADFFGLMGIGLNYLQALEYGVSGTITWYGDNGTPTIIQMSLRLSTRM